MTLIELIHKHTSSQAFEAEAKQTKRDAKTFYQADEAGNTAFHHLVLAMDRGLPEQDAILILCYLMGVEKVAEDKKIDINALGSQQLTALQLAIQKKRDGFVSLMVQFDDVRVDQSSVGYFKEPSSGLKKLAIQTAFLFGRGTAGFNAGFAIKEKAQPLCEMVSLKK
ncbi:MAG TPA: hypothetical protein VFU82_07625 [Gammaproteobacteria bacterium]|nr:hypothetical protein [Gammaproteobacteria bacterium]